jgi:SAM-dependent methyltransferase
VPDRTAEPGAATVTGERVSTPEGGFNPTFQRHVAAYRACALLLPDGPVLDVGCGTGHSFSELAPRESVGVDLDAGALSGQGRETRVADMRELPFSDAAFASVLSVQSIEHVPDPERALTEFARVTGRGGTVVLVTPNRLTFARPDEIIDPYHHVEYDATQLARLCNAAGFSRVEVHGLFGSDRYRALVAEEHAQLDRLLRLDPLRLRRLVPRRALQRLYDRRLRTARATPAQGAAEITAEDFELRGPPLDECLDLVAVCRV